MSKLKLDLHERLSEIMKSHNTDFLLLAIFNYLDTAQLIEFIQYIEEQHDSNN